MEKAVFGSRRRVLALTPNINPGFRPRFVFDCPGPSVYLATAALNFYLSAPGFQFVFTSPFLITIGNNKSQRLHIMLIFLFLLSNSFVAVIVDRNDTKDHLSKLTNVKQINK